LLNIAFAVQWASSWTPLIWPSCPQIKCQVCWAAYVAYDWFDLTALCS